MESHALGPKKNKKTLRKQGFVMFALFLPVGVSSSSIKKKN